MAIRRERGGPPSRQQVMSKKPLTNMTPDELAKETSEFDREFVADSFGTTDEELRPAPSAVKTQNASISYWRYFLSIEGDLEKTTRYVEPVQANYKTYSIEFARILISAGSEIDVVSKALCKKIEPDSGKNANDNINAYRRVITHPYRIYDKKVTIPRNKMSFAPWDEWRGEANPGWWRAYNEVKHDRQMNYKMANLQNALLSVAGLFVLVLYYYYPQRVTKPWPALLGLPDEPLSTYLRPGYKLPVNKMP